MLLVSNTCVVKSTRSYSLMQISSLEIHCFNFVILIEYLPLYFILNKSCSNNDKFERFLDDKNIFNELVLCQYYLKNSFIRSSSILSSLVFVCFLVIHVGLCYIIRLQGRIYFISKQIFLISFMASGRIPADTKTS